jgi:hypothetical protein
MAKDDSSRKGPNRVIPDSKNSRFRPSIREAESERPEGLRVQGFTNLVERGHLRWFLLWILLFFHKLFLKRP